ncbi:MAG TPA: N-6 DNA methylase [Thermoplasmata archaeon]|nr:N-6 DNA methylase [Thermoplasmata archaeon]
MTEVTENTVNELVAAYLQAAGLQISAEPSKATSQGRTQPDFLLRNPEIVYGEGEWQHKFMSGYSQAHNYSSIPGASGTFVITYPDRMKEELARRMKDTQTPSTLLRGFRFGGILMMKGATADLFSGTIDQLHDWLAGGVKLRPRRENSTAFISVMREVVAGLSHYLPTSGDYPSFFEHIIATMPKDPGELETARQAAAYLLLNQVVFYRILSQHGYPSLDPAKLNRPGDLRDVFFETVLKDDYQAIFGPDVSKLFPDRSLQFIKDLVTLVNEVQPESFTRDLLGNIFHDLIPPKVRKSVAAYYTNPLAGRLLAKLTINDASNSAADFACGSGTLLMAAYDRKAELLDHPLTEADHRRFIEKEITGMDIMPFAAHLAVVQLALRNPGYLTDLVRIAVQDSTVSRPGARIRPLESALPHGQSSLMHFAEGKLSPDASVKRGAISGEGKGAGFKLEKVDVTLMNPPFTRKQLVGKEYRRLLTSRFPDYAEYSSKEQSLFGYFVFLADRFLKVGGRMGFVLPTTAIRQMSSEGMRRLLLDKYQIEFVIGASYRLAFSENAAFAEVLIIARKDSGKTATRSNVVLATLKTEPDRANVGHLAAQLHDLGVLAAGGELKPQAVVTTDLDYRIIAQEELRTPDWLIMMPGEESVGIDLSRSPFISHLAGTLGGGRIIQGIRFEGSSKVVNVSNTIVSKPRDTATRLNWVLGEESPRGLHALNPRNGAEVTIPRSALRSAIRSPAGQHTMLVANATDYAVVSRFDGDEHFWEDRNPDTLVARRVPHLDSREGRLVLAGRNHVGLASEETSLLAFCSKDPIVPTWSFWSFKVPDFERARLLCLWLNSTFGLSHLLDRRITGTGAYIGWLKADLDAMPALSPDALSGAQRVSLLRLFDQLAETPFPSLLSQLRTRFEPRVRIDLSLAKVCELAEYATAEELAPLYGRCRAKIEELADIHSK